MAASFLKLERDYSGNETFIDSSIAVPIAVSVQNSDSNNAA